MNQYLTTQHKVGEEFHAPDAPATATGSYALQSSQASPHDDTIVVLWCATLPDPVRDTEPPPAA